MSSRHLSPGQFPDVPYPRLREAYARGVVHHIGESRTVLEMTMRKTGLPLETLKQMAKSDGIENNEKAFEMISKNPHTLYQDAHKTAASHALKYQMSDSLHGRERAKRELLLAFKNRHVAMKSPYFFELVN